MKFLKNLFSSKSLPKPQILIEEKGLSCPITAIVEQDHRVAYFYLWGGEGASFGVKSCWVRNLMPATESVDSKAVGQGIAPMMPKSFCKFPEGQPPLDPADLEIVWLEEGDGAALLEKGEIIAIIPSWSGSNGFFGYARDARGQGNFAWELSEENEMIKRVTASDEFNKSWAAEFNPWWKMQPELLEKYKELFGPCDKYFAIDGEKWPPKGLYLRKGEVKTIFLTVAVSLRSQPTIEMYFESRYEVNRIELGLMFDTSPGEDDLDKIARSISGVAAIPWDNITFLAEGHTVNLNGLESKGFKAAILTQKLNAFPIIELPNYRDSKINVYWLVPIKEEERKYVMANGSEVLIKKLNKIGQEVFSLNRQEIGF